jgi:hypothetical protein
VGTVEEVRRFPAPRATGLLLLITTIAAVAILSSAPAKDSDKGPVIVPAVRDDAVLVNVADSPRGRPIPSGFIGFSFEYSSIPAYAGTNRRAVNPVFEQLIRNVTPGQSPVLRIGGDSTDHSWYPVSGMNPPGGIHYAFTNRWIGVAGAMAQDLHARLIFGINLEANSKRIAADEARALVSGVGRSSVRALEVGNEPELYGSFPWYQSSPGHGVRARSADYNEPAYTREFSALAPALPLVPLAGPATGAPLFMARIPSFVSAARRLGLVTVHRYGLRGCLVGRSSTQYHTIANLLSGPASRGLADSVAPYTQLGLPVRVDELNSVNCGGVTGVSDTFASALWALNTLFEMARVGVTGVNFHTFDGASYAPFSFRRANGRWQASVEPMYYGLLMFARAAPPGSRMLQSSVTRAGAVHVWPLRTPSGALRVVMINESTTTPRTVVLRTPEHDGPAEVQRLIAPSVRAKSGVTLGGLSFGSPTTTGELPGLPHSERLMPARDDEYDVRVPAGSAALLTVQ